jgi:hypothetical protein
MENKVTVGIRPMSRLVSVVNLDEIIICNQCMWAGWDPADKLTMFRRRQLGVELDGGQHAHASVSCNGF